MQRSEMQLDGIMLDDQKNYIAFLEDIANAGLAINSAAYQTLRTGDAECLDQVESLIAHMQKHLARIRRMADRKASFENGYAIGHMQGFQSGKEQGYEEGVRDTHQAFPHLEPHLAQIAKSGAGLTIIAIEAGGRTANDR